MDPSVRSEWTAVEERWAVLTREEDGTTWSGTLNASVPSGDWWVSITGWSGVEGQLTIVYPSRPLHGSNLVTWEPTTAAPRPRWVQMGRALNDWQQVSAVILSLTGEPITDERVGITLDIAWRSRD